MIVNLNPTVYTYYCEHCAWETTRAKGALCPRCGRHWTAVVPPV